MGNVKRNKRADFDGEIWKECPNFQGYKASNFGWVEYPTGHRTLGCVHKTKGYRFTAPNSKNGKVKFYAKAVHLFVADAFLHSRKADQIYVNHKNRDRADNRSDNLEYVTPSENSLHAWNTAKLGFKIIKDLP